MNCIKERRFGIIKFSRDVLLSSRQSELSEFWRNFIPLHMEFRISSNQFVVECGSLLFDVLPEGQELPQYQIQATQSEYPDDVIAITDEHSPGDTYITYKAFKF